MDDSPGFRLRPWWLLALAAVAAGQAGLALHLFPDPAALSDGRPVVAGRHPLHLYHGGLGAATFRDRYTTSCYDPQFQAGCPKTPVFDGGARPAELALLFGNGGHDPAAYKRGLFALALLAPLCFAVAARGAGLSPPGAVLAAVGGCVVWWSPPARALLDAGSVDFLLAGLMGLVFVGGLCRYATDPGPTSWLLLTASVAVGWYAHPVIWFGLVPVGALYYFAVAPRHGLAWHLGLGGSGVCGLAVNLWWLADWAKFWWLRQPSADDLAPLPRWDDLLGGSDDYAAMLGPGALGWFTLIVGLAGLVGMARDGLRLPAGVLTASAVVAVAAARLGQTWPTLQMIHSDRAVPFAVAVFVVPTAWVVAKFWERVTVGRVAVAAVALLPALLGWASDMTAPAANALDLRLAPLPIGLAPEQEELVAGLKRHTTPEARILIEDVDPTRPGWNWTALLPVLTDRAYLGGLDPGACVEHTFVGMRDGRLNGRPFAEWTAAERAEFCRRYNVGWVVCRTPAAAGWWSADLGAKEVGRYRDDGDVVLLALNRPRSFVLAGSATVETADRRRVVFADAVPNEHGELVVSFHHQPGVRVAPSGVLVEADKDLFDPIPMVKLRLPGPVSRVVLTWENP